MLIKSFVFASLNLWYFVALKANEGANELRRCYSRHKQQHQKTCVFAFTHVLIVSATWMFITINCNVSRGLKHTDIYTYIYLYIYIFCQG